MRGLLAGVRCPLSRISTFNRVNMASKNKAKVQQRQAHYSSHIEVYNVDNSTAAPSVVLFFDKQRYLFNAGEGIQRHLNEYKKKIQKMNTIMVTRVSTDTLAGLPGMLLSQVTLGPDGFKADNVTATVYGPQGLSKYCSAFRDYASSFQLKVVEAGPAGNSPIVQEPFVSIIPVILEPATSTAQQTTDANDASAEPAAKRQRTDVSSPTDALQELYDTDAPAAAANGAASKQRAACAALTASDLGRAMSAAAPMVTCYICQLSSIPGKIDPQKAAQLGVPRGPLLGELQRGKAVTAVSGQLIHPHQVMETPDMPGACLMLIDCPSWAYLSALEASPQLQEIQQQAQQLATTAQQSAGGIEGENSVSPADTAPAVRKKFVMLHLGPTDVTSSSRYRAWLAGFGPEVEHLLASSSSQYRSTVRRAATLQAQLNVIEPEVFSLQGFETLVQHQQGLQQQDALRGGLQDDTKQQGGEASAAAGSTGQPNEPAATQPVLNGVRYTLAPQRYQGLSTGDVTAAVDPEAVQADINSSRPAVLHLLQEYCSAKAAVQQEDVPPQLAGTSRTSCELTLLGTCSACPSNHRNVSAYYLDLFDRGGLLVDCGEDAMGQLERRYGREDAARRVLQLHAVWVSHMHADHHGGLYPLLMHRQYLQQQAARMAGADGTSSKQQHRPLLILGPWPLFRVLCDYGKILQFQFVFIPNTYFYTPDPRPPPAECIELYEAVKAAAGLKVLRPFPVEHVAHSTGLQLESRDGWKVVFSGDTRPCQSVVTAAQGATLLVHEATFEDELQDEAIAKKHSTTAEALGVAAAAGAYRTVLTHFSSRYPKIPVMKPQAVVNVAAQAQEASAGNRSSNGAAADSSFDADQAAPAGSDLAAVGSVIVGFDLMSINLADLPWLPKMLPVLDELFKEEEQAYKQEEEAS